MTFQINSVEDLQIGDIGFTSIKGVQGAGVLGGQSAIDMAALLRGQASETAGWLTHAYIVTQAPGDGTAQIVEAMPGGARAAWMEISGNGLNAARIGAGFAYTRLPDDVTQYGAHDAARKALDLVGARYGWAQYAAIAALTLRGGAVANPSGWLAGYVRRSPAMICSQLVDEAYRRAGVHLFSDGRPPGYVTPGALFWRTATIGDVCICA